MRKEQRLKRAADFSIVLGRGRRWSDKLLVAAVHSNGLESTRFGFSISKRVGSAVVRDRLKRRLREVVTGMNLKAGSDVVIIARKGSGDAGFRQLFESATSLLARASVV
ncbi:MAG: ribonuclease P protein component [Chloroflexi bacterium]|nr:ribonuclease P protein component [Chloroflexota bacterium]